MKHRSSYRTRVRRAARWDVALGTLLLSAATIVLSAYLLFAAALDCKHPKFADAPYCAIVHALVR
jgi:hypothetical protein